mgnify:CR=1 FL=1
MITKKEAENLVKMYRLHYQQNIAENELIAQLLMGKVKQSGFCLALTPYSMYSVIKPVFYKIHDYGAIPVAIFKTKLVEFFWGSDTGYSSHIATPEDGVFHANMVLLPDEEEEKGKDGEDALIASNPYYWHLKRSAINTN